MLQGPLPFESGITVGTACPPSVLCGFWDPNILDHFSSPDFLFFFFLFFNLEAGSLVAQAGLESKDNLKLLILLPPPPKSVF